MALARRASEHVGDDEGLCPLLQLRRIGDAIAFVQHVEGCDFKRACELLGETSDWQPTISQPPHVPQPNRITFKPPAGTPPPDMTSRSLGAPVATWPYRDTDGEPLGYVARYQSDDGKVILCWTWGQRGGEPAQWECGHWNRPRPLYNLDRLAAHPEIQIPAARLLKTYQRNFMVLALRPGGLPPPSRPLRRLCYFEQWSEHYQESAAQLISSAYQGHVDSEINDQYRSLGGARRFLYNIVQYPGCGTFFRRGSWAAFDGDTGRICGMCLASIVSPDCGHITQVCVAPGVRGTGIGYELLRRSLAALYESGSRKASLTVTASNRAASDLYESVGFHTAREFAAYVWEGF